jgi:glycerol-3-phosphate dehydrogenase
MWTRRRITRGYCFKEELGEAAADVGPRLRELDHLSESVDEHLAELPGLLERTAVVRPYETVPEEKTDENPLGIYKLTPERIRHRSEEEIGRHEREARARRRSQGFRDLYEVLNLRVVAHKDCTLEVTWGGGQTTLHCPDLRGRG